MRANTNNMYDEFYGWVLQIMWYFALYLEFDPEREYTLNLLKLRIRSYLLIDILFKLKKDIFDDDVGGAQSL